MMHEGLELQARDLEALGNLISSSAEGSYPQRIVGFVGGLVAHDSSILLAYHKDRRPVLLFNGLTNPQRKNSVQSYLQSAYLLDPFYQASLQCSQPVMLRLCDLCDQNSTFVAYLETYYRHSAIIDEINFVVPISASSTFALSIERDSQSREFSPDDLHRLQLLLPVVSGLIARTHAERSPIIPPVDAVHKGLEQRLADFRSDVLTLREREIAGWLLKGRSVAQIAAFLGISVETARVHRRNIYAKLSISSLSELFSMALEWVTDKGG